MEIHESARILENLKKEKEPYDFEIESANERLVRIQKQVSRLEKRIWWKSRAQQQIMDLSKKEEWLKSEINGKMQKVNPIEIQIGICEKRVQEMRREVSACVIEVAEIERSAVDV